MRRSLALFATAIIVLIPLILLSLDIVGKNETPAHTIPKLMTENKFTLLNLNMYHELPAIRGTRDLRARRLSHFIRSHASVHALTLQEVTRSIIFGYPEKTLLTSVPGYQAIYTHVGGIPPILEMGQLTLSAYPVEKHGMHRMRSSYFRSIGFQALRTPFGTINLFNVHIEGTPAEIAELITFVSAVADSGIIVLAGDFNISSYGDKESTLTMLREKGFSQAGHQEPTSGMRIYNSTARPIYYDDAIFYAKVPPTMNVTQSHIFTEPENGVWISDHLGLLFTIEDKNGAQAKH